MFAAMMERAPGSLPPHLHDPALYRDPFRLFGATESDLVHVSQHGLTFSFRPDQLADSVDRSAMIRCPRSNADILFWGRLDNRDEVRAELGVQPNVAANDAALVALAWAMWDRDLPRHLIGDFAIAIVDHQRHRLFLARDPLGTKPLYYRIDDRFVASASTAVALKLPGLPLTIDAAWLAKFLWMDLSADMARSPFAEIMKLPPGHLLDVTGDSPPLIEPWHRWRDDAPPARRRDTRWVDAYRAQLDRAIGCRVDAGGLIGIESSGGLDSATILASVAANATDRSAIKTFGFALNRDDVDLIRAASARWGIVDTLILTDPWVVEPEPMARITAAIGYPPEHGSAANHWPFYVAAEQSGVRHMLSGFGGDEVVTSAAALARFEFARSGQWRTLFDSFQGNPAARGARTAKLIVDSMRHSGQAADFGAGWAARQPHCLLNDAAIDAYGIAPAYAASTRFSAPFRRVNDMVLHHHLASPMVTTRLENCTLAAAAWGIEYRWPLWDVRLVQQYLSTPAIEKIGPRGMGRYLHRRAVQDLVPAEIGWRRSKLTGPAIKQVRLTNGLAASEWARGPLAPPLQGLIDPDKRARGIALLDSATEASQAMLAVRSSLINLAWLNRWLSE